MMLALLYTLATSVSGVPQFYSTSGAIYPLDQHKLAAIAEEHTTFFIVDAPDCEVVCKPGMTAEIWHIWMSHVEFAGRTSDRAAFLVPRNHIPANGWYAVEFTPEHPGTHHATVKCGDVKATITVEAINDIPRSDIPLGFYFDLPDRLPRDEWKQAIKHMADHGVTGITLYARNEHELRAQVDTAIEYGIIDGTQPMPCMFNPEAKVQVARGGAKYPDKWPEFYGYGWDEPSAEALRRWHEWKAGAKWHGPSLTALSGSVALEAGENIEWWLVKHRSWSHSLVDLAAQLDCRLGVYDPYWQP